MNVEWLGVLNVPRSQCRQTDAQSDWWVVGVEELNYVPDYMVVSVASQLISREFRKLDTEGPSLLPGYHGDKLVQQMHKLQHICAVKQA